MASRWTEWRSYPDEYHGEYIQAPIGPGVFEVCRASTREQVAFGCTQNVAQALCDILRPGGLQKRSIFRWSRVRYSIGELEYRTWSTASLSDAKVAVDQILGRREAVWRRFSTAMRA